MCGTGGIQTTARALVTLTTSQNGKLAAPAWTKSADMAFGLRESGFNFLADSDQLSKVGFEVSHSLKELASYLLLLVRNHRNGVLRKTVAFKEVWHQHGCAGMGR